MPYEEGRTSGVHPTEVGVNGRVCMRVVVVGRNGVGKSALAVRFLTKRYIGEYQSTAGKLVKFILREDFQTIIWGIVESEEISDISALWGGG